MAHSQDMGHAPVPVHKFYGPDAWVEGRAEDQLADVARWPGVRAVAAFPDLHPGRYGPVGAAFLADRIYPQLIGPDIGCGMALFRLSLPARKLNLDKAARRLTTLDAGLDADAAEVRVRDAGLTLSGAGLGTIGGGNHFCEVLEVSSAQADTTNLGQGDLCLLVHTGSRGHGAAGFLGADAPWKDGYAAGSSEADAYLRTHDAALRWAALNRRVIADLAAEALRCDATLICDVVHNAVEPWGDGWVHRKGAAKPDGGLAPLAGSRDAESFLMRVTPPAGALGSVSHGAGRKHDRASMHGRIRKTRSGLEEMRRNPWGGRVVCENADLLIEEAGKAYKDPAAVMASLEASDIARRTHTLRPRLTYKTGGRS